MRCPPASTIAEKPRSPMPRSASNGRQERHPHGIDGLGGKGSWTRQREQDDEERAAPHEPDVPTT